jgi:hypothetical protein
MPRRAKTKRRPVQHLLRGQIELVDTLIFFHQTPRNQPKIWRAPVRRVLSLIACLFFLAAAACSTASPDQIRATGDVTDQLTRTLGEIYTNVAVMPKTVNDPPSDTSTLIFQNNGDRAITLMLEGPRTYEVNIAHNADMRLNVKPGNYKGRLSGPSLPTKFESYTFVGGTTYAFPVNIRGQHDPK